MFEMDELRALYTQNKEEILKDYLDFLRFESIATDPNYDDQVEKCANWVTEYLKKSGLQVERWETEGAPTIFASDLRAGPEKETILFYGHYDVQPIDPIEKWISPPFEPTIRDGEVYARGALDDKGQIFYTMAAIRMLLKRRDKLPVNIKIIIEGEEESGSDGLTKILPEKQEPLKSDYLVIVDSGIEEPDRPAITLGARGLVCMEVALQEGKNDMHSGMVGGIAYNPNRALCELLATLHNETGGIAIPGFYDEVAEITPGERKELDFSFNEESFKEMHGFEPTGMEYGIPPKESGWLRPTLEINGISGGYAGAGFKTVIPAKSHAKISCRLVPYQDPYRIASLVQNFLTSKTPKGMTLEVASLHYGKAFRTNPNSRIAKVMSESYTHVFQKPCQKILLGGSIPVAVDLAEAANAEMVLIGLGLPDDQVHAPNEHFGLDRFEKGFLVVARALDLFET